MAFQQYGGISGRGSSTLRRTRNVSVGGVLRSRLDEPGNRLLKFLGALSIGQQAIAGVAKELKSRAEGNIPRPLGQSALRGIQEHASFTEMTNYPAGIALDLIIDPMNLLFVGAVRGAVGKTIGAVAKAAGETAPVRFIARTAEESKAISALKKSLGSKFITDYELKVFSKKHGLSYEKLLAAKDRMLGRLNVVKAEKVDAAEAKIAELVPDPARRSVIAELLDNEPVVHSPYSVESNLWKEEFLALSKEEQEAFHVADRAFKEIEQMKIGTDFLTEGRALGFLEKAGVKRHIPRRLLSRETTIQALREQKGSLVAAKSNGMSKSMLKEINDKIENIDNWIKQVEDMPELITFRDRQRMFLANRNAVMPSFTFARKDLRKLSELTPEERALLETDVARLVGIERQQLNIAKIHQAYLADIVKYMTRNGLAVPNQLIGKPAGEIATQMEKLFGKELPAKLFEGTPFVQTQLKQLQGFRVPQPLADEINRVLGIYMDPKQVEKAYSLFARGTNIWKAWTLVLFPSYHTRNAISNVWNNFLAGMSKPLDFVPGGRYWTAWHLQSRFKLARFTDEVIEGIGMTDRELYQAALRERILAGGEFAGETSGMFGDVLARKGRIARWSHPDTNRAIGVGYKIGRNIEENARMAHFLWRLEKGDTVEQAGKSVRKFLFDYQYGLTKWESDNLRSRWIPFWAWTRFNMPLQLEMLVAAPHKFNLAAKQISTVENQFGGPPPDEIFFADWLKSAPKVRFKYDKKSDTHWYFMLGSWWPAADIGKALSATEAGKELINMINPFPKLGVELWANYSLFRFEKLERIPGERKKVIGVPLPARIEHLARVFRPINEADRAIEAFKVGLKDSAFSAIVNSAMRLTFGKPYPVSQSAQKRYWDYETRKRLAVLKSARRRFEKKRDFNNMELAEDQIKKLEELRKKHLRLR